MIHPVLLYGDPMLKQLSGEIPKEFPKLTELIYDMFETMHKANGVGLSAIQIGIPLRIFVIEARIETQDFHFRGVFINPRIAKEWGEYVKHPEGCLSVPQITATVERKENIELNYYDAEFVHHTKSFNGFEARIIQHEYDHLEGKLYIDRLDRMWEKVLEGPLQLIKDRKIEIPYSYRQ